MLNGVARLTEGDGVEGTAGASLQGGHRTLQSQEKRKQRRTGVCGRRASPVG